MLAHIFNNVLHCDINRIFYYALVKVANDVLYDAKLSKKLSTGVKNFMRKDILLPVDPQVRESFLRRV